MKFAIDRHQMHLRLKGPIMMLEARAKKPRQEMKKMLGDEIWLDGAKGRRKGREGTFIRALIAATTASHGSGCGGYDDEDAGGTSNIMATSAGRGDAVAEHPSGHSKPQTIYCKTPEQRKGYEISVSYSKRGWERIRIEEVSHTRVASLHYAI